MISASAPAVAYECHDCNYGTNSWVDFARHKDSNVHRFNCQKSIILEKLEEIEKVIRRLDMLEYQDKKS